MWRMRAGLWTAIAIILLKAGFCASLRCFSCGGSSPWKCSSFNATSNFTVECGPDERACRKGWLSTPLPGEDPLIRSCTVVAEDICLLQNPGGSCSCTQDLCNGAAITSVSLPISRYYAILLYCLIALDT